MFFTDNHNNRIPFTWQKVGQNKHHFPIHSLSPLIFKPTVQVGQAKTNNPMVPQLTIPTALILLFAIAISVYSQENILQPPSKREQFTITTTNFPYNVDIGPNPPLFHQLLGRIINPPNGIVQIAFKRNKQDSWKNAEVVYYKGVISTKPDKNGVTVVANADAEKIAEAIFEKSPKIHDWQNIRDAYVRHANSTEQYGTFDSTDAVRLSTDDFMSIMDEFIKLKIEAQKEIGLGEKVAIAIPSVILIAGAFFSLFYFKVQIWSWIKSPVEYFGKIAMYKSAEKFFGGSVSGCTIDRKYAVGPISMT